jgi:hypothetical protein
MKELDIESVRRECHAAMALAIAQERTRERRTIPDISTRSGCGAPLARCDSPTAFDGLALNNIGPLDS